MITPYGFVFRGYQFSFTILGLIIALTFATAMIKLLHWMFQVPRPVTYAAAVARRTVGAIKRILVPTVGTEYSERGVELACRLGQEQKATIYLTYMIEVPRTAPLGVELPEAEAHAAEVLERARSIVEQHGLESVVKSDRAREAGEGIIRAARDNEVDIIVMGIRPTVGTAASVLGRTTDILLNKAPCEVLIDKVANPIA